MSNACVTYFDAGGGGPIRLHPLGKTSKTYSSHFRPLEGCPQSNAIIPDPCKETSFLKHGAMHLEKLRMNDTYDEPMKASKQVCPYTTHAYDLESTPYPDGIRHQLGGSNALILTQLFQSLTNLKA